MSISDRINSITTHIENAYTKISSKGGTLPTYKNLSNLENAIDSIQTGVDIKLNSPSLSLGQSTTTSDPLIITNSSNGNFVQYYDVYDSNTLLVTISANIVSNTINLRDYIFTAGTHTIRVIAKGDDFLDSDAVSITYVYVTYVTITRNLSHCTLSDDATAQTQVGDSYLGTLSEDSGYSFAGANVSIIMNGVDVTSSVYDGKRTISIASITGDITINASFVVITHAHEPRIEISNDEMKVRLPNYADSYNVYIGNTFWRNFSASDSTLNLQNYLVIMGRYAITCRTLADGYLESQDSNEEVYENSSGTIPSSTLGDNDWATIALVCQMGDASNYWAIGDTKIDIGLDGLSRTFRICDMQGLYNKHVVFEQVNLDGKEGVNYAWNTTSVWNVRDYSISTMRTNVIPSMLQNYSSSLQATITDTTYKVARGYDDNVELIELTDKLFLPAAKEVSPSGGFANSLENQALITYQYYVSYPSKIKYDRENNASTWYLRSVGSWGSLEVCLVSASGGDSSGNATYARPIATCFAF